jgi:hypothetical protein
MDTTILTKISTKVLAEFKRNFVKFDRIQELIKFLGYQDIVKKSVKTCKFDISKNLLT